MSGYTIVGKRVLPKDGVPKVTGQAKYGAKEGGRGHDYCHGGELTAIFIFIVRRGC